MTESATEPGTSPICPDHPARRGLTVIVVLLVSVVLTVAAGAASLTESEPDSGALDPAVAAFLVDSSGLTPIDVPRLPFAPDLADVVLATVESLEAFWATELPRLYGIEGGARPGLAPFVPSSREIPPCGAATREGAAVRQAFYCAEGDFVAWDAELLLPDAYTYFHPLSPAVILAHEWAHAVQYRAGVTGSTLTVELQADCFAGAWLALATSPALAGPRARFVNRAPRFFAWIGDPHDSRVGDDERHGDGSQRLGAFSQGYGEGPEICVLYESGVPPEVLDN